MQVLKKMKLDQADLLINLIPNHELEKSFGFIHTFMTVTKREFLKEGIEIDFFSVQYSLEKGGTSGREWECYSIRVKAWVNSESTANRLCNLWNGVMEKKYRNVTSSVSLIF